MLLTENQLAAMLENKNRSALATSWIGPLRQAMAEWDITTVNRASAFLAQLIHESASFTRLTENLNYSADRLCVVWPKRFANVQAAAPFAGNPERLANLVYANRMGNGDERSGDGFRFRGRGLIQLTGRDNYTRCARALQLDLLGTPDLLLQPAPASRSAGWFWQSSGLNALADARPGSDPTDDFGRISQKINGGYQGLAERIALWRRALQILTQG